MNYICVWDDFSPHLPSLSVPNLQKIKLNSSSSSSSRSENAKRGAPLAGESAGQVPPQIKNGKFVQQKFCFVGGASLEKKYFWTGSGLFECINIFYSSRYTSTIHMFALFVIYFALCDSMRLLMHEFGLGKGRKRALNGFWVQFTNERRKGERQQN